MTTTIAELLVEIGVNADNQAVKDLNNEVKSFVPNAEQARRGATQFAKGIATVGAVVLGAVGALVKGAASTAEAADEVIKGARRAGVGAQEFQRLAFAAEEADVSQGALIKTSSQFAIMMRDAQRGDAGAKDFVAALGDIGLKFQDLEGLSRTQQFGVIADELNKVEDAGNRTAISAEIFGKRYGPELANLLATGSAGINEVSGSLRNVFTDEQFAAAEEYNDAVTEMKDAFAKVKTEATAGLLPVMTQTVDRISAFIDENEELIEQDLPAFIDKLSVALGDAADFTAELVDDTQALTVEFGRLDTNTDAASRRIQFLVEQFKFLGAQIGIARKALEFFGDAEERQSKRGLGEGVQTVQVRAGIATAEEKTQNERAKMVTQTNTPEGLRAIATNTALDLDTRKSAAKKERQLVQAQEGLGLLRSFGETVRGARAALAESRVAPGEVVEEEEKKKKKRGGRAKAPEGPTAAELIDAAAQGRSSVGGVSTPTPNVAIAITNNNNFEMDFTITGIEGAQDFIREVEPLIQKQINKGNVEASRLITPIRLR